MNNNTHPAALFVAVVSLGNATVEGRFENLSAARDFVDTVSENSVRIPRAQIRGPFGFVENQDPGTREPEIDYCL